MLFLTAPVFSVSSFGKFECAWCLIWIVAGTRRASWRRIDLHCEREQWGLFTCEKLGWVVSLKAGSLVVDIIALVFLASTNFMKLKCVFNCKNYLYNCKCISNLLPPPHKKLILLEPFYCTFVSSLQLNTGVTCNVMSLKNHKWQNIYKNSSSLYNFWERIIQ